jgi:predicted secreted Zn-dependent protease
MWFKKSQVTPDIQGVIGIFDDRRELPVRGIRLLAVSSIVVILSASASVFALNSYPDAPTLTTTATEITQAKVAQPSTHSTPAAAKPVKTVVSSRAVTPTCTRGTEPRPSTIALSDSSNGVILRTDSSNRYRVYGTSTSAIWSQIKRCSPVRDGGVFAADTSYQLSYVYRYAAGSGGLCRVASAAVSMHVSQIFPAWSPASGTSSATTDAWHRFISGLHKHENGHVSIDTSYAHKIYDAMLSAQPASSCNNLKSNVDAAVHHMQAQLTAANDAYDASTGHGRTQGAVL